MKKTFILLGLAGAVPIPAHAEGSGLSEKQSAVMNRLIASYAEEVKENLLKLKEPVPAKVEFSATSGREFFLKRRTWETTDRSCSHCHTENPTQKGKHIESKRPIRPLAPAANPERFVDVQKVEKNLVEHCFDLYNRDCRAEEKGNFLTYLMSVK